MMQNQKSIIHRFYFIILLMVLAGIAIVCKAAIIMFAEKQYWEEVADRFVKENVVVPPTRGNILSADGQLMASSLPEYKIYMDFKAGGEVKDSLLMLYLDSICDGLHKIFPDKSKEAFKAHIKAGRRKGSRNYLLYPKRVSYIQYKQAKALPVFNLSKYKGGFHEEPFNQRKKPFGSLAMRTLGDMFADTALGAKNGLELQYDSVLRGRNGITHRQKVMNKYLNLVDIPPVNGCDLITTIDVSMQDIAEKALVDKLKTLEGATVGVAILMEVQTGDIKAIVNMTKCSDGEFRELRNNAVSDMMEPGSTFKTASIMVALDDGKISVNDEVDTGNGTYKMHGALMKDHNWSHGGYGVIDVPHTLMYSSNIGVSRLIDEKYHDHPEDYVNGLYRIGIAQPLGLGIPGSGDPIVRHPNKNNWSKTALAWMSIGYETQIPPISTLTFYNAIANNGVMVRPRLVKAITKDGETIEENPVEVIVPQIAKPKTVEEIQTILERVVSEGLGRQAGSKQFHVSGKTGTAQVSQGKSGYTNGMRRYLVSFCGYFPSESPKYSCIVAIQKNGLPASGGTQAGPVFRNIAERVYAKHLAQDLMNAKDSTSVLIPDVKRGNIEAADYVLRHIDVPTTGYSNGLLSSATSWLSSSIHHSFVPQWGNVEEEPDRVELTEQEIKSTQVPNVVGMGAKDAVYLVESLGLRAQVSGVGKVKTQSIPAGNKLVKGQTILLKLK
jgi:cell division protein FtsI (penicillin-binding protein 3)